MVRAERDNVEGHEAMCRREHLRRLHTWPRGSDERKVRPKIAVGRLQDAMKVFLDDDSPRPLRNDPEEPFQVLLLTWVLTAPDADRSKIGLTEFEDWRWRAVGPEEEASILNREWAMGLHLCAAWFEDWLRLVRIAWNIVQEGNAPSAAGADGQPAGEVQQACARSETAPGGAMVLPTVPAAQAPPPTQTLPASPTEDGSDPTGKRKSSPKWSKACSKTGASTALGISVDAINDHLRVHPQAVHRVSRQLWQFDKNDPLFCRLP